MLADAKNVTCTDCGQTFPSYGMDFDHVRGPKTLAIATVVQLKKRMTIEELPPRRRQLSVRQWSSSSARTAGQAWEEP